MASAVVTETILKARVSPRIIIPDESRAMKVAPADPVAVLKDASQLILTSPIHGRVHSRGKEAFALWLLGTLPPFFSLNSWKLYSAWIQTSNGESAIPVMQQQCWQGPSPQMVKANFDASFSANERTSWSGVVIRDSEGEVLGACRRYTTHVVLAFMAEALAALHAIELLLDLGFESAVIEGDSLTIIKKLQSQAPDLSVLSALIFDVKEKATMLRNCCFRFVPRGSNRVAHLIAGDFSLNQIDRYWVE